jgi:hypothetical protein
MRTRSEFTTNERDKIGREFIKRVSRRTLNIMKLERLGTFDTFGKYCQYPTDKLARRDDGTPDFEAEETLVRHLYKKTFRMGKYGKKYHPTEGDILRNVAEQFKEM